MQYDLHLVMLWRLHHTNIPINTLKSEMPQFSFFFPWGGLRRSPFGTSAINYLIVPVSGNRLIWSIWWNENWQGKLKYSEETCPSATFSTINPTWLDLGSNLGCHSGKSVTDYLRYDTVLKCHNTEMVANLTIVCINLLQKLISVMPKWGHSTSNHSVYMCVCVYIYIHTNSVTHHMLWINAAGRPLERILWLRILLNGRCGY
jgi:hypothetical protein